MGRCMVKLVEPVVDNSCWMTGVEVFPNRPVDVVKKVNRIILLNSPLAFPGFMVYADRVDASCVKEIVEAAKETGKPIESYIGHPATAALASRILSISVPVNREMYVPERGDLAIVFKLKRRLEKPEDVKDITENDIEILTVHYA